VKQGDCTDTSDCTEIKGFTDIGTAYLQPASIYPNPVSEQVQVKFNELFCGTLTLMDATGKKLFEESMNNTDSATISMGELASGIYFLKAGNVVYRIVKE
jgi:hypothetical protein